MPSQILPGETGSGERGEVVPEPAGKARRGPAGRGAETRAHVACTLQEWRKQFLAAANAVAGLGFGPAFQRMWNLYLAYSEAGFRAGYLDVHQLLLDRRS